MRIAFSSIVFIVLFGLSSVITAKSKDNKIEVIDIDRINEYVESMQANTSSTKYYSSFYSNYTHPLKLQSELSEEQAREQKTYMVAKLDKNENVISIQKILDKKCFFWFIYEYKENQLLSVIKKQCDKE